MSSPVQQSSHPWTLSYPLVSEIVLQAWTSAEALVSNLTNLSNVSLQSVSFDGFSFGPSSVDVLPRILTELEELVSELAHAPLPLLFFVERFGVIPLLFPRR